MVNEGTMTKTITTIGLCMGFGCAPPVNDAVRHDQGEDRDFVDTGGGDTGLACDEPEQFFFDADGDGHGDDALVAVACEIPPGHVRSGGDCDDLDDSVYPGAAERCDGIDQDCDDEVDEDTEVTPWFEDSDGDGYGHPELQVFSCAPLEGYVENGDDCDDSDAQINPGADEVLSKADTDCSGTSDDLTTDDANERLDGDEPTDAFGHTVSGGYDLDDGGVTDIVVGSLGSGEIRVYGGEELVAGVSPWLLLSGAHEGDQFGLAHSLLEDINMDGHADLLVGAPAANPELSGAATVSLFLGPLTALEDGAAPDYILPPVPGDEAGGAVADVGSTGEDQVRFGVQSTTKVGGSLGVQLYRITERAMLESVVEVSGSGTGDRFGEAIGSRFDANGDGFADLAIGAPGAGLGDAPQGMVYIYLSPLGAVLTTEDADLRVVGDSLSGEFGAALAAESDLDGDGIQNLIVGAPGAVSGEGRAHILSLEELSGEVPAEVAAWATLSGAVGRLGHAVHAPGDVDGDGQDDVVIGAPEADGAGLLAGAAYIFWGSGGAGTFAPDASIDAVAPQVNLGTSLGSTAGAPTGAFQSLLVGGHGADVGDDADAEDEPGTLWLFGFAG